MSEIKREEPSVVRSELVLRQEETGLGVLNNRFSYSLDMAFKELSALEERLSIFLLSPTEERHTPTDPVAESPPLLSDLNLTLLVQVRRIMQLGEQISELRNRIDL